MDQKYSTITLPVQLDSGGRSTSGNAVIRVWGDVERNRRALRPLAACPGLAVLSLPLRFANLFLVPAFFALGIALYFRARKKTGHFLSVDAPCPHCANPLTLATQREAYAWPLRLVCARCHEPVLAKPMGHSPWLERRAG